MTAIDQQERRAPLRRIRWPRAWASSASRSGSRRSLAPGRVNRLIGVRDDATSRMWMRAVGVREIAAGVGIFSRAPARASGSGRASRATRWTSPCWARRCAAGASSRLARCAATGAVDRRVRGRRRSTAVRLSRAATDPRSEARSTPMHVRAAITVRRDARGALRVLARLRALPGVHGAPRGGAARPGRTRSHWKARGAAGHERRVGRRDHRGRARASGSRGARWTGSKIDNSGTVRFVAAPGDQGTEVHVELRYDVPGGAVGALVAKLFGEEPAMQVKDDLRRFKQIVETGEIARSEGARQGPDRPDGGCSSNDRRPGFPEEELAGIAQEVPDESHRLVGPRQQGRRSRTSRIRRSSTAATRS